MTHAMTQSAVGVLGPTLEFQRTSKELGVYIKIKLHSGVGHSVSVLLLIPSVPYLFPTFVAKVLQGAQRAYKIRRP